MKWSTSKLREFTLNILNKGGDQVLFEIKIERRIEKREKKVRNHQIPFLFPPITAKL